MKRFHGTALAAVLALAGLGLWSGTAPATLTLFAAYAQEATTTPAPTPPPAPEAVPVVEDMAIGNPDATVTMIEYASYTCPHCASFHAEVWKPLKADYIDTGKVRFIFREVYFDRYGLWAAMTARCGGPERYFGISSLLLEGQKEWAASEDPAVVVANLKTIGRTAGLDDTALAACLDDGAKAQAMVTAYQTNATADAVEGTPTIIINGTKHANMSYADLKVILDAELAK